MDYRMNVNAPVDIEFTPKYVVVDMVNYDGNVIAGFAYKHLARRFVKKAGYHPSRLTIHRVHPTVPATVDA